MKFNKKLYLSIGAILVILIGIFIMVSRGIEAELLTVEKGDLNVTITEKGKIENKESQKLASELSGKVVAVNVEPGQSVQKGQVLGKISTDELEQQIGNLEGKLKSLQGLEKVGSYNSADLKKVDLEVEMAEVALNVAKDDVARLKDLYQEGVATRNELEQAQADLDLKSKAYAQAKAAYDSIAKKESGSSLQYAGERESILTQLDYLKKQLAKAEIKAPFAGFVLAKEIRTGDFVSLGQELFTIGSQESYEVIAYVAPRDIGNLKVADPVTITFEKASQEIKEQGRIEKIAPQAEEQVSVLGITEPRVKLTISLAKTDSELSIISGMEVDLELVTEAVQEALIVPKGAVFSQEGKSYVWMVAEGKAQQKEVVTGLESAVSLEIKDGLKTGDKLIANPTNMNLKEGQKIR